METTKESVHIRICSEIYESEDTAPERISFEADGTFVSRNGKVYLRYDDSSLFDGDKTLVSISFAENNPESVIMLRKGSYSTTFLFEKGQSSPCLYRTPYMSFDFTIRTLEIKNALLCSGELRLDYITELPDHSSQRTVMKISIK